MTGFLALLAGFLLHSPWAAVLLALPISDIVKNSADFLAVRMVRPHPVFRMALEEGIPREGRTLCVIASLLTGEKSGGELAALLERYHLANRDAGRELRLGLLCDLPDRDRPMGEREQAWVETASAAVEQLNKAYGGGFYLFFRVPVFHAPDQRYMGWERKRGALVELVRLLRGKRTGLRTEAGDSTWLRGVRYVVTLDADTALSVGSAKELAGAMLHPLNRPKKIVEAPSILNLLDNEFIVIACGGGGIPVVRDYNNKGCYKGVAAVIDKDMGGELLAEDCDAQVLFLLTAVEHVAINFGKPDQQDLTEISADEAEKLADEGQFGKGSMEPKVRAAIKFARSRKGRVCIIGALDKAAETMAGLSGTRIYA